MRVAFVTFEYPPFILGGAGVYATHITEELTKLGNQVVVFTPGTTNVDCNNDPTSDRLKIWHVPIHETIPFRAFQFWVRLPKEIKKAESKQKFDIIHINGISYWFLRGRLSAAPHVLTVHHLVQDAAKSTDLALLLRIKDISGENGYIIPQIENRALKSIDKIVAVSNYTKDRILQVYHISTKRVDVVYNGVDFEDCTFTQEELTETRKQLGLLQDRAVILYIGRVDDPRKGLDVLIQAFRKVLDENDATLLVVGKGNRTIVQDLLGSALDRVVFTGFVDNTTLKKCYALCSVYVCPSRLEGFGLSILEAFRAGKPVVATRVGAIPELIQDNINGVLVENEDAIGMAKAIDFYLKNELLCKRIGKNNLEKSRGCFSWSLSARHLDKIYKQL